MGSLSMAHWLIVLAIVALVFGTKRIRHLGADLGGAIKDFKAGMQEGETVTQASVEPLALRDAAIEGGQSLRDAKHEYR